MTLFRRHDHVERVNHDDVQGLLVGRMTPREPLGPVDAADDLRRPRALMAGRLVYVAGPMRGYPMHNFPAFDRAARLLRARLGIVPVNPADIDRREFGFDGAYALPEPTVNRMLQRDLRELAQCDAVVLLPGWRRSVGANMERDMAILKGIPRWELVGGRYLIPDRGPGRFRGRIRGMLCHRCNISLGGLGDSVSSLRRAIRYLERNG